MRHKALVWCMVSFGAFGGAGPDLVGAYGTLILHDNYALYGSAHHGAIYAVAKYLPPWWLHCAIDGFWHDPAPPFGWYAWGIYADLGFWLIVLAIGYYFWRRR